MISQERTDAKKVLFYLLLFFVFFGSLTAPLKADEAITTVGLLIL